MIYFFVFIDHPVSSNSIYWTKKQYELSKYFYFDELLLLCMCKSYLHRIGISNIATMYGAYGVKIIFYCV